MKILVTIRTTGTDVRCRYLRHTLASLAAGGVDVDRVAICRHDSLTANLNGLSQIALLTDEDWIVMSEDDLEWCADPLGSLTRWLTDCAVPRVSVYRFFAFDPIPAGDTYVAKVSLREQKGSQVVAMRAEDARRFAAWAHAHPRDWRPREAPFQDRPHDGFDKLIGYWALQDRPAVTYGLVSRPFFVRHVGDVSSIHARVATRDRLFGGTHWSYRGAEVTA